MTYRSLMATVLATGLLASPAMAAGTGQTAEGGQMQQMQEDTAAQSGGGAGGGAMTGESAGGAMPQDAGSGMAAASGDVTQDEDAVRRIQQALVDEGYEIRVDGMWGPETEQALSQFQQDQGIQDQDPAGPETLAALGVDEGIGGGMGEQTPQTATTPQGGGQATDGGDVQQQPAQPAD